MSIANFSILGLIIIIIAILLLFRLLSFFVDKFISRVSIKHWTKRALFALELIVWFIFIYKLAEKSLSTQPILSVIMVLLLVFIVTWTFWFILRDYLAGIYIRMSGRFRLNETIAFEDSLTNIQTTMGKIIRFDSQNMVLELQNLSTVEIPYNKLFNKKIERHVQSVEEELTLVFELKSTKDKEHFMQEMNKQLLELPWINHKHKPKIVLQKQENTKSHLELKLILVDKKYRNRVEEVLMKNFG